MQTSIENNWSETKNIENMWAFQFERNIWLFKTLSWQPQAFANQSNIRQRVSSCLIMVSGHELAKMPPLPTAGLEEISEGKAKGL